ncbi:hypothetical protein DPMN_084176 [Dreissena polymorpha]|uniref:Uncharacterized protein n=1 Tax=Dreissena polymorpha TaxID=45954 RepID=A0A9D4BIC2_DREPO|nr:hypothetical protein DPMN_084176 [Dreissena polymorpha]
MSKFQAYPVCRKATSCSGRTVSYFTSHRWRLSMASYSENSRLPWRIRFSSMNGCAVASRKTPISRIFKSICGHFRCREIVRNFQFTFKETS